MNGTGWNRSASQSQPRQPYTTLLLVVACLLLGSAGCAPAVNQPVSGRLPTPPHGMSRAPAPTVQPHGDHAAPRLHRPIPVVIQPPRPFRVAVAPPDSEYVFNPSGQVIRLEGLLCLFDAVGPCGNAVKDSQRTKTHEETRRTLSVIWGTTALPGRTAEVETWYQALLQAHGCTVRSTWPM